MTTKNQKIEMALAYMREYKFAVQVPLWCGYANVVPFCYHYNNDFHNSELDCINKENGNIKWVVSYYFDNGFVYEERIVYAKTIKEAVSNGYNMAGLYALRSAINE
ncbi:MAG: hypothetical protein IKE91_08780 [Clostridia bacterium]|nr:hypothetical protein [Clostridia bacterium]